MNVASCGQGMGKVSPLHSSYEKGDAMTEEFYESHASCVHGYDGRACATADEGFPQEAVTPKKRARYERIAYSFLSTYDGSDARVRFDVIAIQAMPNSKGFVKHIVNAFGAGA